MTAGAGLISSLPAALAEENHGGITRGDAALLRFAAAAEILETDFWVQYNELGGVQDDEVPGGSGNPSTPPNSRTVDDRTFRNTFTTTPTTNSRTRTF